MAEEQTPVAPAESPKASESVADNPSTNDNTSAQPAPDMHGFTSDQLADMKKFLDNNGGWEKIKSRISNPEPQAPAQPAQTQEQTPAQNPNPTPQQMQQPAQPKLPDGYLTPQAMAVSGFFRNLAQDDRFKAISKDVASGGFIKEMESLGMAPIDAQGNLNMKQIEGFLELKAKTVPAVSTSTEPVESSAPLVEYVKVNDGKISDINQAYSIITQDAQLKRQGKAGHPNVDLAEEFIKNTFTKKA